ncbi:MAG: hypothetical protein RPU59_07765 [Candidatus Sedimenticola sp. (ex Thyasira tokunagai)]
MTTQADVAKHLDMSERNLRDVLRVLGIDWDNCTMDQVRVCYIRNLREKAAGRDTDGNLSAARAREANLKADMLEIQLAEKAGEVVLAEEIERAWLSMVMAAKTELLTLPDKLVTQIKTLHSVDVDPGLIEASIHDSLHHLATDTTGMGE